MFFKGRNFKVEYLLFIGISGYIIKYLMMLYLSTSLTPAVFGDISLGFKTLFLISSLLLFGTTTSSKKFLANYALKKNIGNEQAFVQWNLKVIQKTSILGLIFYTIFILILFFLDNHNIIKVNEYHPIIYFLIISPFLCLALLQSSYISCYKDVILSSIIQKLILYIVMFALMLISVHFFNIALDQYSFPAIIAIVCIIIALSELFFLNTFKLQYKIRLTSLFHKIQPKYSELHSTWYKTSRNYAMSSVIFTFVGFLDLLILEVFESNEQMVGYLSACCLITGFLWLIPQNCYNNISPQISYLLESKEGKKKLQLLINKSNKLSFILTLIISVIIITFSKSILSTFGPSYTQAQLPLIFLVCSGMFGIIKKPITLILSYGGYEQFIFKISISMLVIFLIIGIPATYFFGINGITVTNIIARGFITICSYLKCKKHFKIKPFIIF